MRILGIAFPKKEKYIFLFLETRCPKFARGFNCYIGLLHGLLHDCCMLFHVVSYRLKRSSPSLRPLVRSSARPLVRSSACPLVRSSAAVRCCAGCRCGCRALPCGAVRCCTVPCGAVRAVAVAVTVAVAVAFAAAVAAAATVLGWCR